MSTGLNMNVLKRVGGSRFFLAFVCLVALFTFLSTGFYGSSVESKIENRKKEAYNFCSNKNSSDAIGSTGIWCLRPFPKVPDDWASFIDKHKMTTTKLVPAQHHFVPDAALASSIIHHLLEENNRTHGTFPVSIVDVGAGIGQYGSIFREHAPKIAWKGYDGAGNVETFTQGMVKWIDVTDPDLDTIDTVADWILSLEVGEHIPPSKTQMFLNMLHRHNKKGIILSWAIKGQGGHGHINEKNNDEVIKLVTAMGYSQNEWTDKFTANARKNAGYPYFRGSFLVFQRKEQFSMIPSFVTKALWNN